MHSYILWSVLLALGVHCIPWMCWQHELHAVLPEFLQGFEHSPFPSLSQKGEQASTWLEHQVLQYGWLQGTPGKLEMGVRVLSVWNCPGLCVNNSLTALCYAVNQCGSVPGKGLYRCLLYSYLFYPLFFSSPFSFCLVRITPHIHLTVKYDSFLFML